MQIEMSKFALERQKSPLIFGTGKLVIFIAPTSLDNVIEVRRCHLYASFCLSELILFKEMFRDSGQFVFHSVSLFKERAVC